MTFWYLVSKMRKVLEELQEFIHDLHANDWIDYDEQFVSKNDNFFKYCQYS